MAPASQTNPPSARTMTLSCQTNSATGQTNPLSSQKHSPGSQTNSLPDTESVRRRQTNSPTLQINASTDRMTLSHPISTATGCHSADDSKSSDQYSKTFNTQTSNTTPMQFETGHLYHIFNRGNNSQKIFFNRDNYLFFLTKVKTHIVPHADILAWCLMPNHFHLMVHVNQVEIDLVDTDRMTLSHPISKDAAGVAIDPMTASHRINKRRSLNNSIAIILRSYTRAIQKQEKTHGSLFQAKTKALCLTKIDGISPAWFQSKYGAIIHVDHPEKAYPQVCFDYIHANPVKDGLVKEITDWEFSSALDYAGDRSGKLIRKETATEFGLNFNAAGCH
ncbi:hypothetical protein [Gaoshiqia sediminis]|uniref:Transposase IS200-like domain-containing protein n=1 Tax=Gaoshiqia sediminis TaxID=2986998 RepID=A0AA41Y8B5_9BACT|nr:hypothetical protein [Gaoshiqia sediminis]MCW0481118.1 hypothetical protein [Gaoshiqia sediminis]